MFPEHSPLPKRLLLLMARREPEPLQRIAVVTEFKSGHDCALDEGYAREPWRVAPHRQGIPRAEQEQVFVSARKSAHQPLPIIHEDPRLFSPGFTHVVIKSPINGLEERGVGYTSLPPISLDVHWTTGRNNSKPNSVQHSSLSISSSRRTQPGRATFEIDAF